MSTATATATTSTPPPTQADLVDGWIAKLNAIPGMGQRAERAGQAVLDGRTTYAGQQMGRAHYRTSDRRIVSHGAGCACPDYANAPQHNGRGLCQHRIEAMIAHRLSEHRVGVLAAIFAQATQAGAADARIRASVIYSWDRDREQIQEITGHRHEGSTWVKHYAPGYAQINGKPEAFRFYLRELQAALAQTGWAFQGRTKQGSLGEIWYFSPQAEYPEGTPAHITTRTEAIQAVASWN